MGMMCYFFVGLPATGKSTYCDVMNLEGVRVSSDDFIEIIAKQENVTYDEAWNSSNVRRDAENWIQDCLDHAILNKKNIIIDRTNLSFKSRKKFLDKIPSIYYKIAIVFDVPADHEHRLNNRPGKTIPSHVIKNMRDSYEPPVMAEGFDLIYYIKN